jgi:hypothetical protein
MSSASVSRGAPASSVYSPARSMNDRSFRDDREGGTPRFQSVLVRGGPGGKETEDDDDDERRR